MNKKETKKLDWKYVIFSLFMLSLAYFLAFDGGKQMGYAEGYTDGSQWAINKCDTWTI